MSRSKVEVDFVTTYTGSNHVKRAQSDLEKLGSAAKRMAAIFGVAFAGREIANFGKASLRAFATNEKQVALLTNTMKNLGQEFAANNANKFIDSLALASGKTKEELIPAFQGLFIATGDATKAQSALKLAMDVSSGTGKDLETVQKALSKGFLGNTTSLTRLGAGLDKATLATKNMDLISAVLAKNFSGDAAVAAGTFQGQMDRLNVTMTEAKVIIGTDLVQAFQELSGSKGIASSQSAILKFASGIGDALLGVERLVKIVTLFVTANKGLKDYIASYKAADALEVARANQTTKIADDIAVANKASIAAAKIKAKSDAAALVALTAQKKAAQDKLKAEKDSLNLKLAGQTTDMQNIEIQAALQRGQTEQVTEVLLLQRAIINGNADQAKVLSDMILKSNGLVQDVQGNLSALTASNDPFAHWPAAAKAALDAIKALIASLTGIVIPIVIAPVAPGSPNTPTTPSLTSTVSSSSEIFNKTSGTYMPAGFLGNNGNGTTTINLNVSASPDVTIGATQAASTNGTAVTVNRLDPLYAYR